MGKENGITIDRVLSDTRISLADIDGFAVAVGPGSFTGLRIGIASIKGLALATGKPAAAVPTLDALAWNVPLAADPVCPLLDARKKEVYAALYTWSGSAIVSRMSARALTLEALAGQLTGRTIFTGEASYLYRAEIERLFGDNALFAPRSAVLPSAAAVAEIGGEMLSRGAHADADRLTPMYIRRPEAEVAWEKRMGLR